MSIRATVGTILPSGLMQVIFVESGGLPSRLGEILQRNLLEQAKVEELLNFGDVSEIVDSFTVSTDSSLTERLDLSHFAGEIPGHIPELHFYEDLELWLGDASGCEFAYLFQENKWETFERKFSIRRQNSKVEVYSFWVDEFGNHMSRSADPAAGGQ